MVQFGVGANTYGFSLPFYLYSSVKLTGCLQNGRLAMRRIIRNFLADEARASRILIDGSVAIMAIGLVVAISAIFFMK
jgi:hypothetical protein